MPKKATRRKVAGSRKKQTAKKQKAETKAPTLGRGHELRFDHRVLRTPSDTLNILTAGGLRMGTLAEVFGPNASGKSAFCYQMARYFQEDYPTGQVWIIDSEKSLDWVRMTHVFGLELEGQGDHKPFVVRQVASLEQGFNAIHDAVRESGGSEDRPQFPILVIWDTIAVARPKDELAAAYQLDADELGINAGGMNLRARVMEHGLATAMSAMYGREVTVLLLNQVRTAGFGTWQGPTERHSSGGTALRHYIHYRLFIEKKKRILDDELGIEVGTMSDITIEKSKFSPCPIRFPIEIFDRHGGLIIPRQEIFHVARTVGVLAEHGAWLKFNAEYVTDPEDKSYRWAKMADDDRLRRLAYEGVTRFFRKQYFTVDKLYESLGNVLGAFAPAAAGERPLEWISRHDPFSKGTRE